MELKKRTLPSKLRYWATVQTSETIGLLEPGFARAPFQVMEEAADALDQAEARVAELEAELKTANHWRERHSRDAEAYGIQSNENWKRAQALGSEVERGSWYHTRARAADC
jgi:hypothetical protein